MYHITQDNRVEACTLSEHDAYMHFAQQAAAEVHAQKLRRKCEQALADSLQAAARCGRELEALVANSGDTIDSYFATSAGLRAQWWRGPMEACGAWSAEEDALLRYLVEQLRRKHAAFLAQKYAVTDQGEAECDRLYAEAARCELAESTKTERKYRKLARRLLAAN